jgi:ketosteroid isomerase-like protein
MSGEVTEKFIEALRRLESERELEPIVSLFADDCELGNIVTSEVFHGREGAREFWTSYRDTFGGMESKFRNRIVTEGRAALEWVTEATGPDGRPVAYEGVSILEFGGDRISRFKAYFDPARLGRQVGAAAG